MGRHRDGSPAQRDEPRNLDQGPGRRQRSRLVQVGELSEATDVLASLLVRDRAGRDHACDVGRIPVPDVHLEEACGHDGLVSIAVPGNAWYHLDDETFDNVIFVDRDMWTTYMAFDIFVANSDRHDRNIFVEWNPPLRRKPVDGEQCGLWMLDYGFSGLWPVQKFDELAIAANLENLDPDADLTQKVTNSSRNVTPFQYRRAFALRGSEEREAAVRTICQITDADIDDAVAEVPSAVHDRRSEDAHSGFSPESACSGPYPGRHGLPDVGFGRYGGVRKGIRWVGMPYCSTFMTPTCVRSPLSRNTTTRCSSTSRWTADSGVDIRSRTRSPSLTAAWSPIALATPSTSTKSSPRSHADSC